MDRLTAEAALSHSYLLRYSCPQDEPVSLQPFRIEDELEDSVVTEHGHALSSHWDRYTSHCRHSDLSTLRAVSFVTVFLALRPDTDQRQ